MHSLRTTTADQRARLTPHVERLLTLAEMVGRVDCSAIHATFEEEFVFANDQLLPYLDAVETTLYSELERIMGPRHSMAPMRDEHETVRRLIEELGRYRRHAEGCRWTTVEGMALRRALYRLYSILKVHLAEEELYLGVLERTLDDEEKAALASGIEHAMEQPL